MKVGDRMNWHKVVSNYGHIDIIPVTVLRIGMVKAFVEAPMKRGGTRKVSVTIARLHPVEERNPGTDPKTGEYSTAQMLADELFGGDTSQPLFD